MRLDEERKLVAELLSASVVEKRARKDAEWRLAETIQEAERVVVNAAKEKAVQQEQEQLRCEQQQQQQQQ
jgi:hypothetical protein